VYDGLTYKSNDGGGSWTAQAGSGSNHWRAIASSANGALLAAVVELGYVYTSSDS
jgi:photosystem II stability/assembly factor-like uncharacterized protein